MNILIPMAGAGSRFKRVGYEKQKPLIDVGGKPMIQRVVENLDLDGQYIYLVRATGKEFLELSDILENITPDCSIITLDILTEGAACTCLEATEIINNNQPLVIANCDQIMDWNPIDFIAETNKDNDGVIITFSSNSAKNSFMKLDDDGYAEKFAEKIVISDLATTGVYHWSRGYDFVWSAHEMMRKNIRVNGEFYVCPTYNELVKIGRKFVNFHIKNHWPIGTPEDLEIYLNERYD